jgi:hypothetical protein
MVQLDLDVAKIVALRKEEQLTKDSFKQYLGQFKQEELVNYIVELYENNDVGSDGIDIDNADDIEGM